MDDEISPSALSGMREIRESVATSGSKTIVVQNRERILKRRWKVAWVGWTCDAWYRAEIFVDGPQVMVC